MATLKTFLFEPHERVLVLYRLSERLLSGRRICVLLGNLVRSHLKVKYAIEFNNSLPIGDGLRIFHFNGIVIGDGSRIGSNVTIYNQVTIGGKRTGERIEYPVIQDDVTIYPGARVVGGITVGAGAVIGPNAVVYKDVPPGAKVLNMGSELR